MTNAETRGGSEDWDRAAREVDGDCGLRAAVCGERIPGSSGTTTRTQVGRERTRQFCLLQFAFFLFYGADGNALLSWVGESTLCDGCGVRTVR